MTRKYKYVPMPIGSIKAGFESGMAIQSIGVSMPIGSIKATTT